MNRLFCSPAIAAICLLTLSILGTGCSASRKAASTLRKDSPEFLLRKLEARQIEAKWFEAKARIDFNDGYQSVKASATIRMRSDSAVWVAVRKLGFEVARVLVTADSIYVINRLNNEYGIYGLDYLSKEYNLPANLPILENLLLGNPVFFPATSRTAVVDGPDFLLEEKGDERQTRYRISGGNYRLEEWQYAEPLAQRKMAMALGEYGHTPDKQDFSYFRNLMIESRETGKIEVALKFSEVELNVPKNMAFDIPERYSRMQ